MCKSSVTTLRWDNVASDFLPKQSRSNGKFPKKRIVLNTSDGLTYGTIVGRDNNGGINLKVHSSPHHNHGVTVPFTGNIKARRVDAFPKLAPV